MKALEEHLAERYLLREMTDAESEDFERHFFECAECAAAVEEGEVLMANGRAVAGERQTAKAPAPRVRSQSLWDSLKVWWNRPMAVFLPVAASLVLGSLALYQGAVVIPGLREPRVLPAFQLVGASRGDALQVTVPAQSTAFALSADVPPDVNFPHYLCELTGEGRKVLQLNAPPPEAGQGITLLVPANGLHSGRYVLTISGTATSGDTLHKVSSFPFDLKILN